MNSKRKSAETKYLCIFVLMVSIIVATSNCMVFIKIFKDVEENYKRAELNKTIMYSEQLNNFMIRYETLIKEGTKNILSIEDRDTNKILDRFDLLTKDNEDILYMYVVYTDTKQAIFSDRWDPGEGYNFEERAFYMAPLEGEKLTYIEPQYDIYTEQYVITIGEPVYNDNNEIIAVTGATINLSKVISKINNLNKNSDDSNYLMLVDDNGNIQPGERYHKPRKQVKVFHDDAFDILKRGTPKYVKYKTEEKDRKNKEEREKKKLKEETCSTLLWSIEDKRRTAEIAKDILDRDRLGFDDESFKGEFYHGQKRKKKST